MVIPSKHIASPAAFTGDIESPLIITAKHNVMISLAIPDIDSVRLDVLDTSRNSDISSMKARNAPSMRIAMSRNSSDVS